MSKFRVGIIGCGSISSMHGPSILRQPGAQLVACADTKQERANKAAAEWGCKPYHSYQQMIADERLDVVHLCTPHYLHPPMALYALEHGCHVLTEKPMSIHLEDAQAMVDTAERTGKTLGVIFQNRYNPGAVLAERLLSAGELGAIKAVRAFVTWHRTAEYYSQSDWRGTLEKEGGGVIINQAIHTLDLVRYLVNSPVSQVEASIQNRLHPDVEVEDMAEGLIHFENGVRCSFYTMLYYGTDAPVQIDLVCEKGTITILQEEGHVRFDDGREMTASVQSDLAGTGGKGYWGTSHEKQIAQFYQALEMGVQPEIIGRDAIKTQALVSAIYQSGRNQGIKVSL